MSPVLLLLAPLAVLHAGCSTHDCSTVDPGTRSFEGPTSFRFDSETVQIDLADSFELAVTDSLPPPIVDGRLELFWEIGAGEPAHLLLRVDDIDGEGTFSLADHGGTICACPRGSAQIERGIQPQCIMADAHGGPLMPPPVCEGLDGELVVQVLDELCDDDLGLCAPQQRFELHVPERQDARFSADIEVRWSDVIDEQTCTESGIGPVA